LFHYSVQSPSVILKEKEAKETLLFSLLEQFYSIYFCNIFKALFN
jgi:hypothetical protein